MKAATSYKYMKDYLKEQGVTVDIKKTFYGYEFWVDGSFIKEYKNRDACNLHLKKMYMAKRSEATVIGIHNLLNK
jgi:hypothetical protein